MDMGGDEARSGLFQPSVAFGRRGKLSALPSAFYRCEILGNFYLIIKIGFSFWNYCELYRCVSGTLHER